MNATVVAPLRPVHDADVEGGRCPTDFRFTAAGAVASALKTNKSVVEQRIRRCRRELAEFYREIEGKPPGQPLLIENRAQKGYRLDPESRFVESTAAATGLS